MRLLVLLCAFAMPFVNFFSQRGAFGPDNRTISGRYPTLLVAAGYAFSIWGLLFVWNLVFAAWQMTTREETEAEIAPLRPSVALGFALTAAWSPVFALQIFWLSLLVIVGSLACLAHAAIRLSRATGRTPRITWFAWVPLSLHAGWLSLAAFLNTAQVIVAYRLMSTTDMLWWSLVLFVLAALLLLALDRTMGGNVPFTVAALWGLAAVYVKQSSSPLIGARIAAWTAITIAVVLAATTLSRRFRAATPRATPS